MRVYFSLRPFMEVVLLVDWLFFIIVAVAVAVAIAVNVNVNIATVLKNDDVDDNTMVLLVVLDRTHSLGLINRSFLRSTSYILDVRLAIYDDLALQYYVTTM